MPNSNKEKKDSKRSIVSRYKNYDELDINDVSSKLLDQYKIIGGRKFLNTHEGNYVMPSDEMELRRLEVSHVLTRYVWKGNFSAPVEEKLKNGKATVLDSGHWILDLGNDFPNSTFVGIDIQSSGFPSVNERHPNTGFLEHDLTTGVPFPDETFDYVHMKIMYFALTKQQYINIIHEIVRVTKCDGWIEIFEPNLDMKNLGNSMQAENGFDPMIFLEISKYFKSTNELTNIEHIKMNVSLGEWAGRYNEYSLDSVKQFYKSATYMPDYMGISQKDYQELIDDFDKQ
ncbi:565_t:CDS:2, partial [Racocetra fulgida]